MVFIVPPLFCALRRLFVSFATLANGERNTRVREPSIQFYAGISHADAPCGKEVLRHARALTPWSRATRPPMREPTHRNRCSLPDGSRYPAPRRSNRRQMGGGLVVFGARPRAKQAYIMIARGPYALPFHRVTTARLLIDLNKIADVRVLPVTKEEQGACRPGSAVAPAW